LADWIAALYEDENPLFPLDFPGGFHPKRDIKSGMKTDLYIRLQ